ncbi:MAG: Unknown, probable insecticidal toxin [uncultured Paraburkholderia sp.]|nr:MAG: Unknown, probable insecticidal toxin [uncultured Paraburkholderia sp.]
MRIGQTGMMEEMLQAHGQSQLTSDTVENAFKTYMTRFEEIANLNIVSGYHNSVSDQIGTTYLIGKSAAGDFYWRSTDIGKMSHGKLPANAWSEWKKITAAVRSVNNLVRPVIFQSRLYLVWVESSEAATTSGSSTTQSTKYQLKYAHILHDGTWSSPVTITTGESILPLGDVGIDESGMYCARDAELEKLYIFSTRKRAATQHYPTKWPD